MPLKTVVIVVVVLVLGLVGGFFVGRWTLERQWSQPYVQVGPERSSGDGANPSPPAGATIVRAMPIQRTRKVVRELTAKDPAIVTVGSFGEDDDKIELHAVVENRGKCTITSVEGTGYAFDAWGHPAKANKKGESYFAFSGKDLKIEPGSKSTVVQSMKNIETASLVVATIDKTACADGTAWKRQ